MYKKIGKLQLAEADYKKVIELEDTPEKYQRIFYAYQGLGATVKAVEILESIIAKDTLDAGSYYDAACLYSNGKKIKQDFPKKKSLLSLKKVIHIHTMLSVMMTCSQYVIRRSIRNWLKSIVRSRGTLMC